MRRSLLLVLALVLGTVLANALLPENGYVAISFRGYLIEMSVPTLALCLLLTLLALHVIQKLVRLPAQLRAAAIEKKRARARADLDAGLLEMSAGRWNESELTLARSAREAASPAVHYLAAARAADLQGRRDRRDAWLELAREAATDDPAPALITTAEMNIKDGNTDAALNALGTLERRRDLNPRGLLLLARVYRLRGDFERLLKLEPDLRAARDIPAAAVDEIMDTRYVDMLKAATERGGLAALQAIWSEATAAARRRPGVVVAYARGLARFNEPEQAAAALRELLDADWNESAVLLFGELGGGEPLERLRIAEGWLRARREDPSLLTACARLCLRAELYGKARSYLETSMNIRPRAETAQLLADLVAELGEPEHALQLLRNGIALATGKRADVPRVRQRRFGQPRR
jgi:HemY protein